MVTGMVKVTVLELRVYQHSKSASHMSMEKMGNVKVVLQDKPHPTHALFARRDKCVVTAMDRDMAMRVIAKPHPHSVFHTNSV